jgi:serine phosphatase RsbU (regulator of sigma subunit)
MLLKEWKMPLGTSKLILYTDGLYEITNREGEFCSHPRLVNFISSHRHLPLKDLVDTIVKEHTDFVKSLPALDDVSILGIELE